MGIFFPDLLDLPFSPQKWIAHALTANIVLSHRKTFISNQLSMKPTLPILTIITLITVFVCCFQNNATAKIYYVHHAATGKADGSSWSDAFTELQEAINFSIAGDSICVAAGEYLPTHLKGLDSIRSLTFYISKSISLFGGFEGIPGTEGNFTERNPILHRTLLSGDTGILGVDADNAFHVVYLDHVSDSMILDGFVIALGNGIGASGFDAYGAGIYNDALSGRSNPIIINCGICINKTSESGGGMMNNAGEGGIALPLLKNCSITENNASGGGGISNYADNGGIASPLMINCKLSGNQALTAQGGAVSCIAHSAVASPVMINCIVTGNDSPTSAAFVSFVTGTGESSPEFINCAFSGNTGGAIRVVDLGTQSSLITLRNSILWENTGGAGLSMNGASADVSFSIVQFGFSGEGNLTEDPMFVQQPSINAPHTEGDLHLQEISPAIDAGSNSNVQPGIGTDADDLPRFVNPFNGQAGIVDVGPFEVQSITTSVQPFFSGMEWSVHPVIANNEVVLTIDVKNNNGKFYIHDVKGNIMYARDLAAGKNNYAVDVSRFPHGMYVIHAAADGFHDVRRIIVQ